MLCAACGEPTDDEICACGEPARVGGNIRLVEPLGVGATATTFRALVDLPDGSNIQLAAKAMRVGDPGDRGFHLARREVATLAALDHPGVPRAYGDVVVATGRAPTLWVLQELIDGPTLGDELASRRMALGDVLGIIDEILSIATYLHEQKPPVVHRDIKPGNIVKRLADGRWVLVDFGGVRDAMASKGRTTTLVGTLGYMAPELLRGDPEPASDLYAIGVIGAEMLTRRAPRTMLDWSGRLSWRKHASVPERVARLIDELTDPDVDRRIRSARDARDRISAIRYELRTEGVPMPDALSIPAMREPGPTLDDTLSKKRALLWQSTFDAVTRNSQPGLGDQVTRLVEGAIGRFARGQDRVIGNFVAPSPRSPVDPTDDEDDP